MNLAVVSLTAATVVSCVCATVLFAAPPSLTPASPVPLTIIVYDLPDFKGHAMTLNRPTPDLKTLNFDDKIASLTIQGPGDWVLCENRNYAGHCVRVQSQAGNLKLLQLGGRVSSLYPVPAPAVPASPSASPH